MLAGAYVIQGGHIVSANLMMSSIFGDATEDRVMVTDNVRRRLAGESWSDTVARLGGDEFVLILNQVNQPDDICRIAQQVVQSVAQITLEDGSNAGIGISLFPDDANEADALLNLVDQEMYEVKNSGRCAFRFAREQAARGPPQCA